MNIIINRKIQKTMSDEMNNVQPMTLNDYQKAAMTTCMASCNNLPYMLFNLQGEVGELSSKVAKAIRKGWIHFTETENGKNDIETLWLLKSDINDLNTGLMGELGDVLWQLSGVCSVLGFSLEDIARMNLQKLASRKQRGVIDGNGDNR